MTNKQTQKGGNQSTNVQAENLTIITGIDEKRAREIYQEMNLQLRNDYSQEALEIANRRVLELENSLMPKMSAVEGAIGAFADPSFQLLLVEAQKTAAATERPADYDLLSELLIHRFQKGDSRIIRAGISRAVEIVDEISDDALLGLTVFHVINQFMPVTGNINQGLDLLDRLFGKILYGSLPVGTDWIEHLDILDAVRINSFGGLKKINEFYPDILSGYVDVGFAKESDNHKKALDILTSEKMPLDILVEHELRHNYVRLNILDKDQVNHITINRRDFQNGKIIINSNPLSAQQINAINLIYSFYEKDSNLKNENIKFFMKKWNERNNLKIIREWWDQINIGLTITAVGRVLAHSNAQRCDSSLPPFS